jgi:DNA polymerase
MKYANHESFKILLLAYKIDDGDIKIIDLMKTKIPKEIINIILSPDYLKIAHNATFEITCLSVYLRHKLNYEEWECTMLQCYRAGLPGSLKDVAKILKLPNQKMDEGTLLIKYFSKPCKATKINGGRTRNLPEHDLIKWDTFKEYCGQDVAVEYELYKKLEWVEPSEFEKRLCVLDRKINARGVKIDKQLVESAIYYSVSHAELCMDEARIITGLSNPNSVAQLKAWILERTNFKVDSLTKDTIDSLKVLFAQDKDVCRVLDLRQQLSKTSIKKYITMLNSEYNGSLHNTLQFLGASRTGRWSGRKVQIHNLPKNKLGEDLDSIRESYKNGTAKITEKTPFELSQLLRTVFIPEEDYVLSIVDFSAIEARVLAWLANEKWVMEVFEGDGKIYEATASKMFDVKLEDVTKEQRSMGKTAVLACGYGGGIRAIQNFAPDFEDDKAKVIVDYWRNANKRIVKFWKEVENCIKHTLQTGIPTKYLYLKFRKTKGCLIITLPSGRPLIYLRAKVENNEITYEGVNQTTKKWETKPAWGGLFVENITQAVARDCLAESLINLSNVGFDIAMHIHDEICCVTVSNQVDNMKYIMNKNIEWAPGLVLRSEGFSSKYYMKEE